jgi:hypothetical protein
VERIKQDIKPEIVVGARVVIQDQPDAQGRCLGEHLSYEGEQGIVTAVDRTYTIYQPDAEVLLDNGRSIAVDVENLQLVTKATVTRVSGETSGPKPRVTYLYVVEDEDGEAVYLKTFDRDHAREEKAYQGGKKAGVIITAYAAVKEIR